MRESATGIYYGIDGIDGIDGVLGSSLCMLRRTQLNSLYRDPFLLAVLRESGVGDSVKDPWFTRYPTAPRWMELRRSGTGLRSVKAGITLNPPSLDEHRAVLEQLCVDRDDIVGDDDGLRISVAQRELLDGTIVDVEDTGSLGVLLC